VEKLLRNKAQPNVQDSDERTPLHWAAVNGHANVVSVLAKAKTALGERGCGRRESRRQLFCVVCVVCVARIHIKHAFTPTCRRCGQGRQDSSRLCLLPGPRADCPRAAGGGCTSGPAGQGGGFCLALGRAGGELPWSFGSKGSAWTVILLQRASEREREREKSISALHLTGR
jgi:hypothetical protein